MSGLMHLKDVGFCMHTGRDRLVHVRPSCCMVRKVRSWSAIPKLTVRISCRGRSAAAAVDVCAFDGSTGLCFVESLLSYNACKSLRMIPGAMVTMKHTEHSLPTASFVQGPSLEAHSVQRVPPISEEHIDITAKPRISSTSAF
jgi:hypothetical protein